jgi:hypothetical protein
MTLADNSGTDTIQPRQNDTLSKVKLTIHHQFPGTELVSPLYHSNSATCYLSSDQSVNAGSIIQAGFDVNLTQDNAMGALMYKLQRKNTDQFNEEESTCIQLFIFWEVDSSKKPEVYSYLIEHDKSYIWDEDRLMRQIFWCDLFDIQYGPIEETWLVYDNAVFMTSVNVTCEEGCCKLEMTISEGSIKDDTRRPLYIDMNR